MKEMKRRVETGEVGRIMSLTATYHLRSELSGWHVDPERSGGGCIRAHMGHALDLCRWFCEREPVDIYAEAATLARPELLVEDVGMLIATFQDGLVVSVDASWNRPANWTRWGDVTVRILGSEGVIEGDVTRQAISRTTDTTRWLSYGESMHRLMLNEFVESILAGRPPLVTGSDGKVGVAASVAAYESVRIHRPVQVVV
jgi:predicted dehydrogenase